jgi:hypothetical protein
MIRPDLRDAQAIQRKRNVPDSQRTPQRDEVAEWITDQFVDGDESFGAWTLSDIADEVGYSRTHVTTVVDLYFEPATSHNDDPVLDALGGADIEQSGDGYQAGLRDGFREGVRFALENPELFED